MSTSDRLTHSRTMHTATKVSSSHMVVKEEEDEPESSIDSAWTMPPLPPPYGGQWDAAPSSSFHDCGYGYYGGRHSFSGYGYYDMTQEISALSNRVEDLAQSTRDLHDTVDQYMLSTTQWQNFWDHQFRQINNLL